ncbi:MAG: RnfH family protein [Proteobacteria bacterium]|nr:RnfH family protein [Pseudomonadota bacterium]
MGNAEAGPVAPKMAASRIKVEVAYARPDVQVIIPVEVAAGATLEDAIRVSAIIERFPEIDMATNRVAVFGKLSKLDHALRAGDRVEILRPLITDPRQARKWRAEQGAQSSAG